MINGQKKFSTIRPIKKRDLKKLLHKNSSVSNHTNSSSSFASFGLSTNTRVDKSDLQNVKKELKAIGNKALDRKEEFERCIENLDERSSTISNSFGSVIHAGGVVARLGSPNLKRSASPTIPKVGSPHNNRIGSPNVHKNSKEKGSKKKGASIKVKTEDSDFDDLYDPRPQRKESSKTSSGTHRKKKILKRSTLSEDDSDFSDFEKVKGSRTSTPNRTAQNKTLKSGNAGSFKKRKRSTSEVTNAATDDTPVVKSNVAIKTFYDYVEPYVRDFKDEDVQFLEAKGDDITPYEIPKLGRHYVEVWAEEERNLLPQTPDELESRRDDHMDIDGPPKSHDGDDEQRSANFIVDRLLAAFLEYPEASNFINQPDESQVNGQNGHYERVEMDRDKSMDDRLKRELQALDLMDENDVQWDEREDDEISIKLRELQAKLREQSKRNNYRKQILIEKVKAQIGWQQYQSYLETLDTQIEEAYLARFVSNFFSLQVESLLDQRKKLVEGIGASFAPEEYSFTPGKLLFDKEALAKL
ncbi:21304_t:CDS:2 [Rhizophagus irregularis]|nr:21304_t:CDS:2 [Rhizophagus irregularis]